MLQIESLKPGTGRARASNLRVNHSRDRIARRAVALCAALASLLPGIALAQVKIGLVLSLTGPAASLGIPARDTVALLPGRSVGRASNTSCSTTRPIPRRPCRTPRS
ncbi:ABC-type branched-chain amino acid transport system, periplasmic component (fragment) [Paraburkholderia dioscoreae]|uniref:ABC-type branched-chain amino acid transport system, periplasmic component n=1 Tax=Paraburkholderia dioscoreae TaxID=2604047 RepID=A0A5Q4ZA21_9BURK